jgi:tetratricopeptide (TPR) repeat protein
MISTWEFTKACLVVLFLVGLVGGFIFYTIKKSEDPAQMVFKWIITAVVLVVLFGVAGRWVGQGGYGAAFGGIPLTAVCGLALAIIWRRDIASLVANPIASLYDGGNTEPDPHPAYSIAMALQKKGRFTEAIAEIRKQLARFPTDVEGQMLLAQILAEDLKDLPGAEIAIDHFCSQPGHAPKNMVFALYSMADWHLKYGQDRDAAERYLKKVIELLPDTEFALGAAQRIAHLSSPEMLVESEDRKRYQLPEGDPRMGLKLEPRHKMPVEKDPTDLIAEHVRHLEAHPLDMEAREKLAVLYLDHYQRLDLASEQIEQMITEPNQPPKKVVHWLNLLADLQVRAGCDYETVRQTLQRIIDVNPDLAAAELARTRMGLLKLELKGKETTSSVKMGTYEQNIGLKRSRKT